MRIITFSSPMPGVIERTPDSQEIRYCTRILSVVTAVTRYRTGTKSDKASNNRQMANTASKKIPIPFNMANKTATPHHLPSIVKNHFLQMYPEGSMFPMLYMLHTQFVLQF